MIEMKEKQVVATFGTGDIGVADMLGFDGRKMVGFINQSAREIGSLGDYSKGDEVDANDFQILFNFTKIESIDVIIRGLEQAKKMFIVNAISRENLDKRICDVELESMNEETYREFIIKSEAEFGMRAYPLDYMTDIQLQEHLEFLDYLWEK